MRYSKTSIFTALTLFFSVILVLTGFASNNQEHPTTENDTIKVNLLIEQAGNHFYSDLKKTQEYALEAHQLAEKLKFTRGLSLSSYYLALVYQNYNFDPTLTSRF
jgi:hypothetical protein